MEGTPGGSRFSALYRSSAFTTEKTEDHGGPQASCGILKAGDTTERIIGRAIEVHRATGPGLLESVYELCLCHELHGAGIAFERQAVVPVFYKGRRNSQGFRADIVVARAVIVEVKAVAAILPAHEAQVQTYLRMSELRIGLIMNFAATRPIDGLRRFIV